MNPAILSKILGGLKYVPASLGIKVLEKAHPMFKNYFANVTAYGLDASKALDYVTERFSNPSEYEESLKSRNPDQLRTDERIAKNEIATSKAPGKLLRNAASLATGLSLAPSEEKPQDTSADQVQETAAPPQVENSDSQPQIGQQQKPQPQPQSGAYNFIAQHPELGAYLDQQIKAGIPPDQAATQAKSMKRFRAAIEDIEGKLGQDLVSIISQLFGKGQNAQRPTQHPQKQSGGISEALMMLRDLQSKMKGTRG